MQLTLYHYWRSSCSWRVRWGLALKGLAYASVPVNILSGEPKTPAYLAKNPSGLLPALAIDDGHGDVRIFGESLAILEWLEETHPTPALLPQDPLARMHVRQLALTIASGTQPLQNPTTLKQVAADEAERRRHAQHFIGHGLKVYEELLQRGKPGRFSHGDSVTLADLCLVPQVYNALRFDVALSPVIQGLYERCLATPACEVAHPANQPGAQ